MFCAVNTANFDLCAVNTKVKAMRASLLTPRDYEGLCEKGGLPEAHSPEHDLAKISCYVSKPMRDYLQRVYIPALNAATMPTLPPGDKSGRESLGRVIGTETDLRNIVWIYRLKKYHKVHGDAVFAFLNPAGHRLTPREISRLAHAKNLDEFAQITASGFYGDVFAGLPDFARAEQRVTNALRRQYRREYRRENIAVVCGYLFARHLEARNLHAIAKGKAHGLSPREIFSLLHL